MSNYALVKNGIVKIIIVANSNFINSLPNKNDYIESTNANIGDSYNAEEDIFVAPQPYPSWIRSGSFWNPPTPMPTTEGKFYYWSEDDLSWRERL